MKSAFAASAAAITAVAVLTLSLGTTPTALADEAPVKATLPLKLADIGKPAAKSSPCCDYKKHTCVQREAYNCPYNGSKYRYRTRTRTIAQDCTQSEVFGDWTCYEIIGDTCYG